MEVEDIAVGDGVAAVVLRGHPADRLHLEVHDGRGEARIVTRGADGLGAREGGVQRRDGKDEKDKKDEELGSPLRPRMSKSQQSRHPARQWDE